MFWNNYKLVGSCKKYQRGLLYPIPSFPPMVTSLHSCRALSKSGDWLAHCNQLAIKLHHFIHVLIFFMSLCMILWHYHIYSLLGYFWVCVRSIAQFVENWDLNSIESSDLWIRHFSIYLGLYLINILPFILFNL